MCERIAAHSGGTVILAFSRGKDGIAAWLTLRRFFARIIPFHLAPVPGLRIIEESLEYYESYFGTRILRFMHPSSMAMLHDLVFQRLEDEERIDLLDIWNYQMHDIVDLIRERYDASRAWCAFGISAKDSIVRRSYAGAGGERRENEDRRSFYPIADWTKADVLAAIDAAGLKLPRDYLLANRSIGSLRHRWLARLESVCPEDFAQVELMFPFVRAVLARNAFRAPRARRQSSRPPCAAAPSP